MLKRPLIWILGAYLVGMYIAWLQYSIVVAIILTLIFCLSLYLFLFQIKIKQINKKDSFLWCLPVLLFLGFYAMKDQMRLPLLSEAFEETIPCELTGTVDMIVEKQWGQALYLKYNMITLEQGDSYLSEYIIVNCYDKQNYLVGNKIIVYGTLIKFLSASNPGQFNEQLYYQIQNVDFKMKAEQIIITDNDYSRYHAILGKLKDKLIQVYATILSEDESGTLIAMLLGEKYLLGDEINQLYQENGISHVLAISGLHISLIGMCVFQLLKRIKLPITVATMVSIFIIYSYGVLTNFSVSTNRAVVMMVVMLLSSLFGKTYDILSSLALSALLILLQNPLQIFSTGFLLSFGAVLGIAVLYPSLQKMRKVKKHNMHDKSTSFTEKNVDEKNENTEIEIRDKEVQGEKIRGNEVLGKEVRGEEVQSKEIQSKEIQGEETVIEKAATDTKNGMQLVVNKIMDSILLSFSAQIATTPFLLLFFFQLPTYSIITNLLILPFVSVLTITSILAGIAGIIYMPLGIFLIGGSNYILKLYEWICRAGSSLPGHMITIGKPDRIRILIYFFLVFLFVWLTTKYEKRKTLWIIVVAYVMLLFPDGNNGLEITILDVGQGDSIFISSENGNTYLVDSGSSDIKQLGSYRIQPFLHSKGIDTLTYVIITHSDYDHTSGVTELITEDLIKVETLVLPKLTSKDDAYLELELLAKERGIELRYISTGDLIRDGALTMLCLHPSQNYAASSPNSYSTVLSVNYGDFDMLLTGDLEKDGEALLSKLLKKPGIWDGYEIQPAVDYDVLKVAHHGSKNSTGKEFLTVIKPELSLISCGKDNRYGHPHKELLERLSQIGCERFITYECGAITITTEGKNMIVDTYCVTEGRP